MGCQVNGSREITFSSFSQLPGSSPSSLLHTYTPRYFISLSPHPIIFWWVFWILNETIEGTPKSLPACMWAVSCRRAQYPFGAQLARPSCEQKLEVEGHIRIWAPHAALLELPVLFYITRSFWWQMLWKEEDSQFRWPVCVWGEATGKWNRRGRLCSTWLQRTSQDSSGSLVG